MFLGRKLEMDGLMASLEEAMSGRGQVVMLTGEPGIGKTRAATEIIKVAESHGVNVLSGWCHETESAPPYWPWIQALRAIIETRDSEELKPLIRTSASDIADLFPHLRSDTPNLEPHHMISPEQGRFRLYTSVVDILKSISSNRPVLLFLDDLHWADESSLDLLEFVAREIEDTPLMILGAYRDIELDRKHMLSDTLGELIRNPYFRRIPLRGLERQYISKFVGSAPSIEASVELVELLYTRTEGNPLFIIETVKWLEQEKGDGKHLDLLDLSIPDGVREVIGRRLNRVSDQCNYALVTAAVIGREFALDQLHPLLEILSEDSSLELLEEALQASLIEEFSSVAGSYRFTHALIRETLLREISGTRRLHLHVQIAEAFETLYRHDLQSHATELAYHFAQAQGAGNSEKVAKYSRLAGDQALAAHAFSDALNHYQQAMANCREGNNEQLSAVLSGLGRAQAAMDQTEQAKENLKRSFRLYIEMDDIDGAVGVVESLPPGMGLLGLSQMTGEALELVPPNSLRAGWLLARYGNEVALEQGNFELAFRSLHQAIEIARRERDICLEMRSLVNIASAYGWQTDMDSAMEYSKMAILLAKECDDPYVEALARLWAASSTFAKGNPSDARLHAEAGLDISERLGHRWMRANHLDINHAIARSMGNWEDAYEFGEMGLAVVPSEPRILGGMAITAYEQGDYEQGDRYLNRILDTVRIQTGVALNFVLPYCSTAIAIRASISEDDDRNIEIAEEIARQVTSSRTLTPLPKVMAWGSLALIAVMRHDSDSARKCIPFVTGMRGTLWLIQGDLLLALLAKTAGDLDTSRGHMDDALEFCRKGDFLPHLGWSLYEYSSLLLSIKDPHNRQLTSNMLEESLQISTDLGMRPLQAKVRSLIEQFESARQVPQAEYPDGLTRREVEILQHIAAGKTDREIAADLFITRYTVSNHVKNILGKTGSANRTEAASYAIRNNLLTDA